MKSNVLFDKCQTEKQEAEPLKRKGCNWGWLLPLHNRMGRVWEEWNWQQDLPVPDGWKAHGETKSRQGGLRLEEDWGQRPLEALQGGAQQREGRVLNESARILPISNGEAGERGGEDQESEFHQHPVVVGVPMRGIQLEQGEEVAAGTMKGQYLLIFYFLGHFHFFVFQWDYFVRISF